MLSTKSESLNPNPRSTELAFELHLTREMLADYLGLTIETVSRQISALKNDGVIIVQTQRQIIIPDFARLHRETGSQ